MTDDNRNQQEGTPSADPIRQEPHEIKIEIPEHIRDMTPHELAEYARANPEEWEKAVKSMNDSWHKLGNTLAESVGKTVTSAALAAMTGVMTEDLAKTISGVSEQLFNADFGISAQLGKMDFGIKSEIIARRITEIEASLQRIIRSVAIANQLPDDIDADALDALYKECEELKPYIAAELEKRKEELADMTAEEFIDYLPVIAPRKTDKEEIPAEEKTRGQQLIDDVKADLLAILNAARAARDAQEAAAKAAPHITIKGTENITYPVDKPNNNLWDNVWRALKENPDGQLTFAFDMAKNRSKEELPLYLSINFNELTDVQITKKLTPFDKRVYIAVSALFDAGNLIITLSQIYKHMGYKGRAGGSDLEKIHKSIVKMMGAQISVDNELESKKYTRYKLFRYRGVLLPVEIGELYDVQGTLTDAAIHILKEPPLMSFAKGRDQVTTVSLKLLQSPVNKTDANLAIDDYLIVQINRAKKGKDHGRKRMLFKTIYKNTGIPDKPTTNTEKQQKKRAPGKIEKYLKHYQAEGLVTKFTMETDGITVIW